MLPWFVLDRSLSVVFYSNRVMQILLKNMSTNVVLIREDSSQHNAVSTFDHNDLNAYLLVVVGLAHPPEDSVALYDSLVKKSQAHESIPLRDIQVSVSPSCPPKDLVIYVRHKPSRSTHWCG